MSLTGTRVGRTTPQLAGGTYQCERCGLVCKNPNYLPRTLCKDCKQVERTTMTGPARTLTGTKLPTKPKALPPAGKHGPRTDDEKAFDDAFMLTEGRKLRGY